MRVREAAPPEYTELLSILDAAALRTDSDRIRAAIDRGAVLVALPDRPDGTDAPILGTLVLDGATIRAIAVRPGRRGQGVGRALVAHAQQSSQRLIAECDPGVRPFWEAVGFTITDESGGRLTGEWTA
ncbi:GNAT family N-acetyltransferase [Halovenus sp. WSH3]|uniref:GNAT family N-acetyltransferase n=1 Tax=Halovenus carboxidivorans TaxID=2692199 RepID=A0A6B0SZ99_9EURY|nr:GNAT family N-acetyltransferase [Halovenus carboxidivorans]MXR50984.1 GNAT family N-acetyltransferase [Halovenus carboxidivorans]